MEERKKTNIEILVAIEQNVPDTRLVADTKQPYDRAATSHWMTEQHSIFRHIDLYPANSFYSVNQKTQCHTLYRCLSSTISIFNSLNAYNVKGKKCCMPYPDLGSKNN